MKRQKRSGLTLFFSGIIIFISTLLWAVVWSLELGIYVLALGYPIIYLGMLGLLLILIGAYALLNNPRTRGLMLLIVGLSIAGVGLFYTINVYLNFEFFKNEPQVLVYLIIPIIIGVIIFMGGIQKILIPQFK